MKALYGLGGLAMMGGFIYGMWYIAKNVSYWLFYESMVKETVMQVLTAQGLL